MAELHSIDTPRPNHSTGPKTPEGKARCRVNAYRHGLTGQLNVFTPEEKEAFDIHCKIIHEALAPVGDYERKVAESIAADEWRLERARAIENGAFALAMQPGAPDAGSSPVDDAFAQSRTWYDQARSLQLLTVYEQRIQRAWARNVAYLESLQAKRKEVAKEAMREAKLLYQLAQAEGRPYQPETYFITAPEVPESVFSTPEVARELSREILMADATTHWVHSPRPTRVMTTPAPGQGTAGDNSSS